MGILVLKIIVFLLAAYGLTFGLVYSNGPFHLFKGIRYALGKISVQFTEMLECTFCTPCQIGLWSSILNLWLLPTIPLTPCFLIFNDINLWYYIIFCDTFVTGAVVYLIDTFQTRLDKNS